MILRPLLALLFISGCSFGAALSDPLVLVLSYDQKILMIFKQEGKTISQVGTIPVGEGAREFCVSADGARVYISNEKANTLTIGDLSDMRAVATLELPNVKRPDGCATSADSKKLYLAGLGSNDLTVIDTSTAKIVKRIPIGEETRRVLRSPEGNRLYIASEGANKITVLDTRTDEIVNSFPSGGQGPRAMYFLPDKKTMLNLNVDDDTMSFIDTTGPKVNLTIGVGGAPQRIELSSDGKYAFILSSLEDKISVVDLKAAHIRAGKFLPAPHQPAGMALSKAENLLFVSSRAENSLVGYDLSTMKVVTKVAVSQPMGVATR